jgi:hypothetical protein
MVYSYAIDHLGFQSSHFDVRKGNVRVCSFHERLGARRTGETEHDILYEMDGPSILKARNELKAFLPKAVIVQH